MEAVSIIQKFRFQMRLVYKIAAFLIFVLLTTSLSAFASDKGWKWIDGATVQGMIKEGSGLWLIDVRNPMAFEAEHIEGSVNIPSTGLAYKKFPANKILILLDESLGQKISRDAADMLVRNGYEKVFVLEGGLVNWKLNGLPVVESKPVVRGLTVGELKWAFSNNIPVKIFDMRDASEREKGRMENSKPVSGKNINKRMEELKDMLKKEKGGLSAGLGKTKTIVLVFSASEDAEGLIRKKLHGTNADIRYLIGGYESFIAKDEAHVKITGACPTCPKK